MKRTRIGNTEVNQDSSVFLFNTPIWQMRQSEVRVMSYLDVLQECAIYATLESEVTRIYNEMDKYYCIAKIIENLGTNEAYLINAFYVYNEAVQSGAFDHVYQDEIERNNHVNETVCNIINDSINYTVSDSVIIDQQLWTWWQENILHQNFYTDPKTGAQTETKPNAKPATIAGVEFDFVGNFKKSAVCYAYTAVSKETVNSSSIARLKRKKQNEIRNALSVCDVQLDNSVQANYIVSGIMSTTGGYGPSEFVNSIKRASKSKKNRIGDPISAAVASIIVAAITFFTTLVAAVINARSARLKTEAKTALQNGDKYAPSDNDFLDIDLDGDGRNDLPKLLLLGAAALAFYLFT